MGTIVKPNTFSANTTISSSQMNANFDTIYNEFNGSIAAANLATDAVTTTKIAASAVTAAKLDTDSVTTAKIAASAVTPAKRAGGFAHGFITGATLNSTGNKSVTGVGFTPKMVHFVISSNATDTAAGSDVRGYTLQGFMFADGTEFAHAQSSDGGGGSRYSTNAACIILNTSASNNTPVLSAKYVSMDADGFTINVTVASSAAGVYWIAYG